MVSNRVAPARGPIAPRGVRRLPAGNPTAWPSSAEPPTGGRTISARGGLHRSAPDLARPADRARAAASRSRARPGAAAADDRVWRLMRTVASDPVAFHGWIATALEAARGRQRGRRSASFAGRTGRGREQPLPGAAARATACSRSATAGSLRPAWGTGANTEAKLLLLTHAFERLGCLRVEFKTDAPQRALAGGAGRDPGDVRRRLRQAHAGAGRRSGATRPGTA